VSSSIFLANSATTTTPSGTALASAAVAQPQESNAPSASLTVAAIDPQDHTRLDKYLTALNAPLKMGLDAEQIANALIPTMQSVLQARPDLANAQFDFESDSGSIRVTSSSMSASDKAWLQAQLNGNTALVQAVQTFHDDAVEGYTTWADADGNSLSQSDLESVNKQADTLTGFMALFAGLASTAQSSLMKNGSYYTANGEQMNLATNPSSAAGFLNFMRSVQAAANGTSRFVSSSGHTTYGALRMNIFEMNSSAMPNFFPASDTKTLGLNEQA